MILREIREDDVGPLSRIVCDVWSMGSYGRGVAMPGSVLYLCDCIARSSFFRVAEVDGRVVGCVGSRFRDERPDTSWAVRMASDARRKLSSDDDGRTLLSDFDAYDAADAELAKASGIDMDFELVLLLLDRGARGLGIGRTMFDEACGFLLSRGAEDVSIFTDSDCNIAFYDSVGAVLRGSSSVECLREPLEIFVYALSLGDPPASLEGPGAR